MRKLKLQMHGNDLNWDDQVNDFSIDNLKKVEGILLGRNTAEEFIPYWDRVASDPTDALFDLGKRLTEIPKIVFSKKLRKTKWDNATLAKTDIVKDVSKLKEQEGKEMIVYGGYSFVAALIKHGLIDEYHLLVNPLATGKRQPILKTLNGLPLTLDKCKTFRCGTILLRYSGRK